MSSAQEHPFESILFPSSDIVGRAQSEDTLHDLALDQVFARIDEDAPRAGSAFRSLLPTVDAVEYRQAVFRCLEQSAMRSAVETFLDAMNDCDRCDHAASKSSYPYEGELWHLRAVVTYAAAVEGFHSALTAALVGDDESSEAWTRLECHLGDYRSSLTFTDMSSDARGVRQRIAELRYNALLRGLKVTIAVTDGEDDFGEQVRSTFERFRQGEVSDHRTSFREADMDHIQGWMLERAAEVHTGPFADLIDFARGTTQYREPALVRFTDEVRFYLAYLDHIAPMRAAGLPMCCPQVSADSKTLRVGDTWDIALASRLVADDATVVTNDLALDGDERILVISGPNQGGKTTMARMFGQLHHLAAIGCPVPGESASIFLSDRVLTVFEREEALDTLAGRLGAEVQRLHAVFAEATERSVIVINEAFASTALHDARILTHDVLERISRLDALGVCVTFIDELSRLNEKTVSMVSTVDPSDPAIRTFRVERRVADGRAYARALAQKYGLTFEQIRDRMSPPQITGAEAEGALS